MSNPQQRFSSDMGRVVLFYANEAKGADAGQLAAVARQARACGVDTICVKRADGGIRWYANLMQIEAEYKAVTAQGVGYVPFTFEYGPRFGFQQIDAEVAILLELTEATAQARGGEGFVIGDKEDGYNNQAAAAQHFADLIINKPGLYGLTTWADPDQQGWDGVVRALLPVVNGWIPQAYNTWLGAQLGEDIRLGELNIQPAIDLSQEFGANNQYAIASQAKGRGESAIWLWEYSLMQAQRQLTQSLAALMHH